MQNITEDFFLELFKNQFSDHPAGLISELPELGAVEYTDPAQIKDISFFDRSGEDAQDRYNFLLLERDRLLKIIRSSPITNQETGACYVACLELDEIHKELDEINGGVN